MKRLNTPKTMFLAWLALVIGAFTIPRLFAPPDGVDLAPLAGLVSLVLVLAALIAATVSMIHTLHARTGYDKVSLLAGIAPFIISLVAVTGGATVLFG